MRTVDLFSGCGGLSLGAIGAGCNIVAAFDNWDNAIEVYRANLQHPVFKQDLSNIKVTVEQVKKWNPELVIGGPPCQDFSHAGKRSEGARANLTIAFAETIRKVRPPWFLMENVARAFGSSAFREASDILRDADYGLSTIILDASLCGVPQKRKRLFCIGHLNDTDGFLNDFLKFRLAKKPLTVREYLGDELDFEHYYRHPRNYSRRAIYSVDEPAATIRGVNRPVPSGYRRHDGDSVHPREAMPLTTEQRARIQTFPSSFRWLGTKTAKEQMIGNAVPVKLAEFVIRCIVDYSEGKFCASTNLRLPLSVNADGYGWRALQDVAH